MKILKVTEERSRIRSWESDPELGVGSGVGSGSISQSYESADPDPHQYVTDPPELHAVRLQFSTLRSGMNGKVGSRSTTLLPSRGNIS
jgi:hypothetical protein